MVPLGVGGGITVIAGVSGTDLILDTNGDYRGGVVTELNGLTGNVTLMSTTETILIDPDPELVVYDDEGRPFAIRSQLLEPLLLNEVQKQRREIESQRAVIDDLKARLEKLEGETAPKSSD